MLRKQGPHYCEGHARSQQLCVWPEAQTQTNAILCLCPPHCYVWEQTMIHLHGKKLVERSCICTHALQASHAFHRLIDGDHKFSIKTLKGQIQGDLKSPITEAWLNLDLDPQ
jgi:hypothetical protein